MLTKPPCSKLKDNKGMAALEMIPILLIIVLLVNYSLGFFGVIHTGILNSIASRNYAFETFRNRSNLTYFSSTSTDALVTKYDKQKFRFHGTTSEKNTRSEWVATARKIDFFSFNNRVENSGTVQEHQKVINSLPDGRNTTVKANPVWIKTQYGICLNATCGS